MNLYTKKTVQTPLLEIEYLEWNPQGKQTIVLTHGWPDAPITWTPIAQALAAQGNRVVAPALRGFAGTRFLSTQTPRSGQLAALGRDMLDFIDALALSNPILVGHDWGARAVANAVGLRPGVASHLVMLSVGYGTNDPNQALSYAQTKNYWYHWFMATDRGERAVRHDGKDFAKMMWDTWSPPGWYEEADFDETALAFDNPDWPDIVLHSYRQRWGHAPSFPEYAEDDAKLNPAPVISTPTLVMHGAVDYCSNPDMSAGKEHYFSGRYERVLIENAGHFPQKEQPAQVLKEILRFCF
jgi:pimeloyl-ACP methyl ester carboxylesterase